MNLRRIFFASIVIAAAVTSLPSIAETPSQRIERRVHDAAFNASVYLPGAAQTMHFRNGTASAPSKLREGNHVMRGVTSATVDRFVRNASVSTLDAVHPHGAIVVHTSGTFSGNSVFTDVVVFQYRGGRVARAAAHPVLGQVQNVEFNGNTLKVTYLAVGPDDARCCPTVRKEMTLRYAHGRLTELRP